MMIIYLLPILSLFLFYDINVQAGNSALCFLTYRPIREQVEFIRQLAQDALQYHVDVFIMIDDNSFNNSDIETSANLQLLKIPNEKCLQHNYQKTIMLNKALKITAWDKALLYFCILNKDYSFVWLIENDVFIPSTRAFRSIHELYSNTSDLIVPRNGLNLLGNRSSWLWPMAANVFTPPWSNSMVNVVGLSRRMLTAIDSYVQWFGYVPFHEFLFNTLAIQLNLTLVTPTELSTDVYSTTYYFEDIQKQPNNLWHPVKDYNIQKLWQQRLINESLMVNHTIEVTNVDALCHTNQTMTYIEQQLRNLLVQFEIKKSQFSPNDRRLLRQYFIYLAKQCQNRNATKEIISLARELADHAYKLPEAPVKELVRKKSAHHLELENALKENRELIFRLVSNSSIVNQLRKQTTNLIKELTLEIQREYQEEQESQNQTNLSLTTSLSSTLSTTAITTRLFSSNRMKIVKVNYEFHWLKKRMNDYMPESLEDNTIILFVIITICCILIVFFTWKKIQHLDFI